MSAADSDRCRVAAFRKARARRRQGREARRYTAIAWTERTWNPIPGCSLVSGECRDCYAMKMAWRLSRIGRTAEKYRGLTRMTKAGAVWTGKQTLWEDELAKPLRWRKPTLIFVNSMGDTAYEQTPVDWFARILEVMTEAHARRGHLFQCLTKRPQNLARLLDLVGVHEPLPGIWWGVSAGNQKHWDERVPWLLDGAIPNCLPWVSVEPQLGPIDRDPVGLGWIVGGGEHQTNRHHQARGFDLAWAYRLIDRCQAAEVPVFIKQLGDNAWRAGQRFPTARAGANPAEWPEDLRIRQYPAAWSGT